MAKEVREVDTGDGGPTTANSLVSMTPGRFVLSDDGMLLSQMASLTTSETCHITVNRICAMLICDGIPSANLAVDEGDSVRYDDRPGGST